MKSTALRRGSKRKPAAAASASASDSAPACSAVVVAAGTSSRMGGKVRKPYLLLRRRPLLAWTLAALAQVENLREIVLVTRREDRKAAAAAARQARLPRSVRLRFADGGARRQDSVHNGVKAASARSEVVLIHDAARPFPPLDAMHAAIAQARATGAAILAVRVKDTVKREAPASAPARRGAAPAPCSVRTSNIPAALMAPPPITAPARIAATVPRAGLWLAQTPQVFKRGALLKLFERLMRECPDREATDDASICELFHQPVALIESSETNFKVTRPEDLAMAEAYLAARWGRHSCLP